MSFLAPLYLLLAGAAAVPLLLHLLRRNIAARVEFPAARYLLRAEQEHSRSLRLRNLLLMLLRVLLVLAVALAAAQPFVRGVGVGHGSTAVAIVLDNSLSTTAVTRGAPTFDVLRDATRALLRAATPADRLWLVTADGRLRGGSRDVLLAELDRIAPLQGAGDLPLALRRASAAVQTAPAPARVVAVATDGQRTAWRDAARLAGAASVFVPDGAPPRNRAVVAAAAEPARWTPRGAVTARVDVPDSVGFRVVLDDRTLARGTAARDEPISVRVAPAERGWRAGRVEIEPDDYPADDVRHFGVWIGAPPAVSADPSAGPFVATAVATLVADGRVTTGTAVHVASGDAVAGLPALIVPPSDPVRLGAANRALERLGIPWRFGALERAPGIVRGARLDGVTLAERYRLVALPGQPVDTLATASGEPWIVAGSGYVLLATRLDPSATTLPVRAMFVPWLADVLALRLGAPVGDLGAPIDAVPGQRVRVPRGADALETSTGERRPVQGDVVDAPDARGVWLIMRAGRRIGAIVVNAPPEESDLARWSAGALENRLAARAALARSARTADAWVRETFAAGTRRPALTPLLLLACLLLAAESAAVRVSRISNA